MKGSAPARSVVIPWGIPKEFFAGRISSALCLIIGTRKPSTDLKRPNNALREYDVAV
jgi:hypothetical protein